MSTDPTVDFAAPTPASASAAEPAAPKAPQLNIYTVMLGLALLFVCLACIFLFLEMRTYELKIKP
jgi:hypothetical protein